MLEIQRFYCDIIIASQYTIGMYLGIFTEHQKFFGIPILTSLLIVSLSVVSVFQTLFFNHQLAWIIGNNILRTAHTTSLYFTQKTLKKSKSPFDRDLQKHMGIFQGIILVQFFFMIYGMFTNWYFDWNETIPYYKFKIVFYVEFLLWLVHTILKFIVPSIFVITMWFIKIYCPHRLPPDIAKYFKTARQIDCVVFNEKTEDNCAVCLDDFEKGKKIIELECKHRFHGECISSWFFQSETCPICRNKMG